MQVIVEGKLEFTFDHSVDASSYDRWSFYRNQFQNGCFRANKAVDMLCIERDTAWLIEVKDYQRNERTKSMDLIDEVAIKVRDSLAGILAAKTAANDAEEKRFAAKLLRARRVRVVLHIEQPGKTSRLHSPTIDLADQKDRLRSLIKAIDPHPIVMSTQRKLPDVPWQVQRKP